MGMGLGTRKTALGWYSRHVLCLLQASHYYKYKQQFIFPGECPGGQPSEEQGVLGRVQRGQEQRGD